MHTNPPYDEWIAEIQASRKYHTLGLPDETLRDLIAQELPRHKNAREALKEVKAKLHQIVAPYLGDPDFDAARLALQTAFDSHDPQAVRAQCALLLAAHASTRERLPILEGFYPRLWAVTGQPKTMLDLACGLNPLAFPWMDLPLSTQYYTYDLNRPRLEFLHDFARMQGLAALGDAHDILVQPPQVQAEVALFFKEAHRFEQRQHACNRAFWQALRVHWLLVSLPTSNLTGTISLLEGHRRLVYQTLQGLDWPVTEVLFENELVFCIEKPQ